MAIDLEHQVKEYEIEVSYTPVLNFSIEQSCIPLIQSVSIKNNSSVALNQAVLELQLQPNLGDLYSIALSEIPPGETLLLEEVKYPVLPGKLRQVVEAEIATLVCTLRQEDVLCKSSCQIEILAFNHWPGVRAPEGLLASFALPNHSSNIPLLHGVRDYLGSETGNNALDGYQSRLPQRVYKQVEGLYKTIQVQGISYAEVPASFENHGQKVRLPDMILQEGLGCCLDISLLMVGCLEQMGLNPVVFLINGHAFLGVWLLDDRFPEGVVDDIARIRNAVEAGLLLPFDSSTCVVSPSVPLETAVGVARSYLQDDERFRYMIDVKVIRRAGFRPIPLRAEVKEPESLASQEPLIGLPPVRAIEDDSLEKNPPDSVQTRFQRWQEKLLDLSLRNKLLNFSFTSKSALELLVPNISAFEDTLAAGKPFEILPNPVIRGSQEAQARLSVGEMNAILREDLQKGAIHSVQSEDVLIRTLTELDRTSRSDFEEGGAHTLYIAIGFLKWFESEQNTQERFSPLLLYPIGLEFDRSKRRFRLRRLSEDPVANVTLVEKMRRNYGVDLSYLLDIEPDESGLDIPRLLQEVRMAILRIPRWEVIEDAHIGLFSFTKFLMWKDLHDNAEILMQNEVVKHIASPSTEPFKQTGSNNVPLSEVPCVVDADSTQMSAIASALEGKSFVLQGPPGTGKSQTITNLIAALLGEGKRVLFVSEKMAALDVVQRRLLEIGLGDFCLELHNHKSNRKEVLESLGKVLNRSVIASTLPWAERCKELETLRVKLDTLCEALHQKHPLGISYHQALDRLIELAGSPEIRLAIPDMLALEEGHYREMQESVAEFSERARAVEPSPQHPWHLSERTEWSAKDQEELSDQLSACKEAIRDVLAFREAFAQKSASALPENLEELSQWCEILVVASESPIPLKSLQGDSWTGVERRALKYLQQKRTYEVQKAELLTRWRNDLLERENSSEIEQFRRTLNAHPLLAFFQLWGSKNKLKPLAIGEFAPNDKVLQDLEMAQSLRNELQNLRSEENWLLEGIPEYTQETLEELEGLIAAGNKVQAISTTSFPAELFKQLTKPNVELVGAAQKVLEGLAHLVELEAKVAASLSLERLPLPSLGTPNHINEFEALLSLWQQNISGFRSWCFYRKAMLPLKEQGLIPLAEAHQQGHIEADRLPEAFENSLLKRWSLAIQDQAPALRDFDGPAHHRLIERFVSLDKEHLQLTRKWIIAQLEDRLPKVGIAAEGSEPGILQRELKKKIKQMPVRKLLQSIPNLIFRLKPCFMMSPMSIAQYLPADWQRFDVVVFDEASQIGTHDSIGAIARGQQVIIVGDSKQLPPTTFFQRQTDSDDAVPNENDVLELESILDEALAKQIPQQMLGWHYRSRHDSLIDFSNRHYYESRLQILPSSARVVEDLGIKWHPVLTGVYQNAKSAGKAGTNPIEAAALVDYLVETLRKTPPGKRTFGVVTFNMAQQSLILDLLDEKRSQYPEIEGHFSGLEGVFVKNLENVQGDERDEILFSICYAKDENGKLRMHFGPLSTSGGERRLNVAITRARCQLRVFSTLTYDQIDLSKTNSVGTAHLRSFLQFVSQQGSDETWRMACSRKANSSFEECIKRELETQGYELHSQIGCGSYRIDLGVVDPEKPGCYLMGIETDGENYHSGKYARDRERIRRQLLRALGWRFHKVWAMDWIEDPKAQLVKIEEALKQPPEEAPPVEIVPELEEKVDMEQEMAIAHAPVVEVAVDPNVRPYIQAILKPSGDQETFYFQNSDALIHQQLQEVVSIEGPIHRELLYRRIMTPWRLSRCTDRVKRRLEGLLKALTGLQKIKQRGDFYWPSNLEDLKFYRTSSDPNVSREADYLPPEEIALAAQWIISNSLSIQQEDAIRETAKLFGIQRIGPNVGTAFEAGIKLLCATGDCSLDGGLIRWNK